MRPKIKVCGLRTPEIRDLALELGLDYFGLVLNVDFSPRAVTLAQAAELLGGPDSAARGVLVVWNPDQDALDGLARLPRPAAVQLAGQEPEETARQIRRRLPGVEIWKVLHLPQAQDMDQGDDALLEPFAQDMIQAWAATGVVDRLLLDATGRLAAGGTGRAVDWELAGRLTAFSPLPMLLAGGLNPANIARAHAQVHPWGLDLSSGVESARGVKDPGLIRALAQAVRALA